LARLLLDPASVPGSDRPSLLVGDYAFSPEIEDLAVLERFGNLGARLAAPFVATASPLMIGHRSLAVPVDAVDVKRLSQAPACEAWRLLRKSASARWVALTVPRVLCRLPYGKKSDPAETFGYEEGIAGLTHENLLWGNSAFAVAAVYAAGFAAQGWQMNLVAGVPRLDGFPLYVYKEAGETVTKPCAEVLLSERVVEAMMEFGLLPVVSHRNTDVVSLPSLQTIADPRTPIPL
jgi:type VI secretion system protein ImpC